MQKAVKATEIVTVPIPKILFQKIEKRLEKTEFKSVGEYITYVLEQVLLELDENSGGKSSKKSDNPFSKEDQESVEQRLRDLGYL